MGALEHVSTEVERPRPTFCNMHQLAQATAKRSQKILRVESFGRLPF